MNLQLFTSMRILLWLKILMIFSNVGNFVLIWSILRGWIRELWWWNRLKPFLMTWWTKSKLPHLTPEVKQIFGHKFQNLLICFFEMWNLRYCLHLFSPLWQEIKDFSIPISLGFPMHIFLTQTCPRRRWNPDPLLKWRDCQHCIMQMLVFTCSLTRYEI
jgi:hypothetical protein